MIHAMNKTSILAYCGPTYNVGRFVFSKNKVAPALYKKCANAICKSSKC